MGTSILLCTEDNYIALGFDGDEGEGEGGNDRIPGPNIDFYGDLLMGSPIQSEECVLLLMKREAEHVPVGDYAKRLMNGALELSMRRDAIDWISKVHAYYNFGPMSAYLSINYLDRFLAACDLPKDKAWMTQLISVACLSLAAKMEETMVPLSPDLQVGEAKYVFEAKTIQRMELLVLSTLKWKMQAVTPFSFIDYFLHKFNGGNSPEKELILLSVELILSTIKGIGFLEFSPSEIAVAVSLYALGKAAMEEIDKATTLCIHVNKERVLRCYGEIREAALMESWPPKNASPPTSSVPRSPNGVLEVTCLSYKSDDISDGSNVNSLQSSPAPKRRKLSRPSVS